MNKVTQNPQWKVGTTANSIVNRNTGNVGIGTTAPAYKLHVSSTEAAAIDMAIETTQDQYAGFRLKNSVGHWRHRVASTTGNYDFVNVTNTTTPFTISLAAPGSSLVIDGSGNITAGQNLTVSGDLQATALSASGVLIEGTYTPTSTNITNVDSSTPAVAGYFRIGNTVHVYGAVTIDATATGAISISLTIPIARNFTAASQLAGMTVNSNSDIGRIAADTANDYAVLTGNSSVTAARVWAYSFDYFM